jgi:hypothetical protein
MCSRIPTASVDIPNRRSVRIRRPQGRPSQSRSVMAAATEPTSWRNSVSVHTGLPGSLAQPPPHGPFCDFEPRRGQPPWAAVRFPLPRSWRSRSATAARRRSGSARGTRHPARLVEPSSIPLIRFSALIGTACTDLSAADGRAPGRRQERGRSLADAYNLAAGSPPPAAGGPARARCRTCARKGPVSGRSGPGYWRPSGRRRRPRWA